MQLKDFADLATALSLIIAALTFALSLVERVARERRAQLLSWQRVVVLKIIEQGSTTFDDIKLRYIAEAQ